MRRVLLGLAAAGLLGAAFQAAPKRETVVFVTGNLGGTLTPCGCTKPMSGGILRRATALRELGGKGTRVVLDVGGQVAGVARQDEIKLETIAEVWKAAGVAAANLAYSEARLGAGAVGAAAALSGGRLVCTTLAGDAIEGLARWREAGPFLIGGVDPRCSALAEALDAKDLGVDRSIQDLVAEAARRRRAAVLLFSGGPDLAHDVARRHPRLALVAHFSTARPDGRLSRVGKVVLVSPGEQGRFILRLAWDGARFSRSDAVDLGPSYRDDPKAAAIYETYQRRVRAEKLIDRVPRAPSPAFAGTKACGGCHEAAMGAWRKSAHAHALATLEKDGHDQDPDCVGCHVVGLQSRGGFRSKAATPDLADVGCESCHGPGASHAAKPAEASMGRVGARSCAPCHTSNASPGFDYAKYWDRIRH